MPECRHGRGSRQSQALAPQPAKRLCPHRPPLALPCQNGAERECGARPVAPSPALPTATYWPTDLPHVSPYRRPRRPRTAVHGRAAPLVHPDTAAEIVGRRHHRHKVRADVHPIGQRPLPDRWEVGETSSRSICELRSRKTFVTPLDNISPVNRAGDHIARRQIFPLRRMVLHEWLTAPVNQPRSRPSHSLGDQK